MMTGPWLFSYSVKVSNSLVHPDVTPRADNLCRSNDFYQSMTKRTNFIHIVTPHSAGVSITSGVGSGAS